MRGIGPKVLKELGIDGGVEVSSVDPAGTAGLGGVREGDVLMRIDRSPLAGVESYRLRVARLAPGQMVSVLVYRDGAELYLAFRHK